MTERTKTETSQGKSQSDQTSKVRRNGLWAGGAVFALWCANFAYAYYSKTSVSETGAFGDTFGVMTSLFSGLAFVGLVIAIFLQRQELNIVKEERNDTKIIMGRQEDNITNQNVLMRKQVFETTFFNMLDLLTKSRETVEYNSEKSMYRGGRAFELLFKNEFKNNDAAAGQRFTLKIVLKTYRTDKEFDFSVKAHLRQIKETFYLVDRSPFEDKNKLQYAKLIRSQLSVGELGYLFFDAYSKEIDNVGDPDDVTWKCLDEKYSILEYAEQAFHNDDDKKTFICLYKHQRKADNQADTQQTTVTA